MSKILDWLFPFRVELRAYRQAINGLDDSLKVQLYDGNWNFDPYMHGMANGMIFARSLFGNMRPEYLEPPVDGWGCDKPLNLELAMEPAPAAGSEQQGRSE